jgi:predicted RNA-binding protein
MCLASAYLSAKGTRPFLENITDIKLAGDDIQMETMFGEETVIQGRVLEVDFQNSKIIIQPSSKSTMGDRPEENKKDGETEK